MTFTCINMDDVLQLSNILSEVKKRSVENKVVRRLKIPRISSTQSEIDMLFEKIPPCMHVQIQQIEINFILPWIHQFIKVYLFMLALLLKCYRTKWYMKWIVYWTWDMKSSGIIWGFWSNEHGQHIPSTTKLSYTITLQSRTVFGCASVNTVRGQYPTNRARSLWEFGLRSIRCSANRARFGTTQSRSSPHKHRDSIGQLHEHGYLVGN